MDLSFEWVVQKDSLKQFKSTGNGECIVSPIFVHDNFEFAIQCYPDGLR